MGVILAAPYQGAHAMHFVALHVATACADRSKHSQPKNSPITFSAITAHACAHDFQTQLAHTNAPSPFPTPASQLPPPLPQLLLSALDRSRRMAGTPTNRVPRCGFWRTLRPEHLLQLERVLQEPGWWRRGAAAGEGLNGLTAERQNLGDNQKERQQQQQQQKQGQQKQGRQQQQEVALGANAGSVTRPCQPGRADAAGDAGDDSSGYDEDGLRTVWSSGPSEAQRVARAAWRGVPLRRLVEWQQSSRDVEAHFLLPPGKGCVEHRAAVFHVRHHA